MASIFNEKIANIKTKFMRHFVLNLVFDDKHFKYDFITGFHTNSKNKIVHHVYDFSWLIFSDETVLIFRK